MVKNGSKRIREGTFKKGEVPHHIIWKRDSSDTKQESLDTTPAMVAFGGANFDSVSHLKKDMEEKAHELQRSKYKLVQVEAHQKKEIQKLILWYALHSETQRLGFNILYLGGLRLGSCHKTPRYIW